MCKVKFNASRSLEETQDVLAIIKPASNAWLNKRIRVGCSNRKPPPFILDIF
jgi:hypothetical protein